MPMNDRVTVGPSRQTQTLITTGPTVTHTGDRPSAEAEAVVARVIRRWQRLADSHGGLSAYTDAVRSRSAATTATDNEVTGERIRERLGL